VFRMMTHHRVIIGDSAMMLEIADESGHLVVTLPPCYNAPFDYEGMFASYDDYLALLRNVSRELF